MHSNAPVFPPNHREIVARLWEYDYLVYEFLDAWTCDEAAQIVSGIEPLGFNQRDADEFELISRIISRCYIAKTIDSFETVDGIMYLKPLSVIEWAIQKEYKLQEHILGWYEEKLNEPYLGTIESDVEAQPVSLLSDSERDDAENQIDNVNLKCDKENSETQDERHSQLHDLIWRVYHFLSTDNKKVVAHKVWLEIQNNYEEHDTEEIIQQVTPNEILWSSRYANEQKLQRRTFDKTLSTIKKKKRSL